VALRALTAGESHGCALTAIIEGLPAGVGVDLAAVNADLARRQKGYGRGGRMAIERDRAQVFGGVRHGASTGAPVALTIANRDWENWSDEMSVAPPAEGWVSEREVRTPRPGHADLAGGMKYRHRDMRNVLERASARETAARVGIGALCRGLLTMTGVTVHSVVTAIGAVSWAGSGEWDEGLIAAADSSEVSCPDERTAGAMRQAIDAARQAGDSLGGVFEVRAHGVPTGLGSHVFWDRRLDSRLAAALMSIPAIKGVECGLGFEAAGLPGSQVHDPIVRVEGQRVVGRSSNNAGGLEGGISNGEAVVVRAAMKPIPTLVTALPSVCLDDLSARAAHAERSDVCAVPAAAVVGEAMVCFVLADAMLEKFGGDHMDDVLAAMAAHASGAKSIWESSGRA